MEQSEESIFNDVLALESEEDRDEFLARACAGRPELLTSVRSLLDAYSRNAFLDDTMLPEEFARSIASANAKRMNGTVGPYHILRQIGHGGMGSVYMAEQRHPVRRMVAIKVIRQGLDSRDAVRRFHQEQRTLAMMDHPNIARVLDASITESGVSYFVMELVNGIPILAFCEKHPLDVEQRLRLFIDCCQAIHHAHQKGIIHRDIKPSNVLVTVHDGQPIVKVIDFGIAKAFATDNPGPMPSGNTFATQLGEFLGTPQYMSPEQAALDGVPLDTRTDIYSLGALLYAILTGGPPFDSTRLRKATFDEIRQIVREKDPLRPSVLVRARAAAQDTTGNSGLSSTTRRLSQQLSGDLDCIVMKALEKDRERRYSTVNDLAEDIRNFLDNKPIQARAPTAIYTLRKLTQRHRSLVLGAVSAMLCLLVGATAALIEANRASVAETVASRERDAAVDARKIMAETLYASDLRLASAATIARDAVTANDALQRHVPKPGETDPRSFDWHFLAAQNRIETRELLKTNKALYAMCRISRSSQIACCGMEGTIWILDELTGKLLHTIPADQGEVNGLASSPDGTILASTGDDGTIAFWDVATGAAKDRFRAHTRQAFQVAYSVDGQRIATCGNEPSVRIWTIADRSLLCEIPSGGHDLECLAVSINDDLAFGAEGGLVTLTRMPTTAGEVPQFRTMSDVSFDHCAAVAFSPDGRFLAAGRINGKVIVEAVDPADAHLRKEFLLSDAVNSLTFSADGRSIGAGARDGTVSLLNLRFGDENEYRTSVHDSINDHAGTPLERDNDGIGAGTGSSDPVSNSPLTVASRFSDADSNRIESWPLHAGSSACVLFSQDGDGVLSVGADGRCRRITDQNLASVKFVSNSSEQIQFDCQNRLLVTLTISEDVFYAPESLPDGSGVRQTDEKQRPAIWRPTIAKETGTVYSVIAGPDRNKAILRWSHDLQNSGVVWRAAADEHLAMYAVSPNEQFLAVETVKFRDGQHAEQFEMTIWDLKRQKEVSRHACERAYRIAFFPGSQTAAYSKSDGVVLFEPLSGATLRFLPVAAITEFAISPDGQELATVSDDRMLRIWRIEDGAELHCIQAHGVSAKDVAYTPDGRTLGSVGMDGLFRCWRRDVMQMTMEVPFPTQLVLLAFSPDGRKAAIQDGQGRAFLLTTAEPSTTANVGKNQ